MADKDEKEILASVIRTQFAEFDANHIMVPELKRFLINTRGY